MKKNKKSFEEKLEEAVSDIEEEDTKKWVKDIKEYIKYLENKGEYDKTH